MKHLLFMSVVVMGGFLAGCAKNQPIVIDQTQYRDIVIPESLYNCPQAKIPSGQGLTNRQVANTISTLVKNNQICKINNDKIRQYVNAYNKANKEAVKGKK